MKKGEKCIVNSAEKSCLITVRFEELELNHIYFDYLNVGDKVRYYPQFNCYYEKYDKSHDSYAICPICGTRNDIASDSCSRCGVPVIK